MINMLPGPDYIYKCPKCDNLISKGSLLSGNTFEATIYSDSKMIAPMLPEIPDLTKCNKCNEILWLSDLEPIGEKDWGFIINTLLEDELKEPEDPWKDAQKAKFLSIKDYYRALDSEAANTQDKEQHVRLHLWWAYNDRIRKGKKIFTDTLDELSWTDNCRKLISILEQSKVRPRQKFLRAEIHRNLGEFDECISILQSINDKNYIESIKILINECERGNKWLVQLN